MTYNKFNSTNNAICLLDLPIINSDVVFIAKGNFNRFPTANFIIKMTKYDADGVTVLGRENMLITTRVGATFNVGARAYEAVPTSDAATTNILQALPFAIDDVIECVLSAEVIIDIQDEVARLETAKLNLAGGALTGLLRQAQGANIASATTTNLALATGNSVKITGTTTITGFGTVQAGTIMNLTFTGILTLTHHATSMILPGGANIITAVGDVAIMESQGGGNWKCLAFTRADGLPVFVAPIDLSIFGARTKIFTASGDIDAGDVVCISASDTVVKMGILSAVPTTSSVALAPTTSRSAKSMRIDDDGRYLHIMGGWGGLASPLVAQVRTIDAPATNFTNGTEAIIFNTSNGVRYYDVCEIDTGKFLLIYQKDNAGAAGGIACKVITVAGATITVGAEQVIETTGLLDFCPACSKTSANTALISYRRDSDSDTYCQVLTVSGTTITTNTAVLIAVAGTGQMILSSCQLSANTIAVVSAQASNTIVFGWVITVAGTVPTIGASNTIYDQGGALSQSRLGVARISNTRFLFIHGSAGQFVTDFCAIVTVSGATMTKGTNYTFGTTAYQTHYYGISIIGNIALVGRFTSGTNIQLNTLDISGATPTLIGSVSNLPITSGTQQGLAIAKVQPFVYVIGGGLQPDGDYLIKFAVNALVTRIIGVAESAIANAATGAITLRFQRAVLTGLTSGRVYFVDDNGQPTLQSSLISPQLGISMNTTEILLT